MPFTLRRSSVDVKGLASMMRWARTGPMPGTLISSCKLAVFGSIFPRSDSLRRGVFGNGAGEGRTGAGEADICATSAGAASRSGWKKASNESTPVFDGCFGRRAVKRPMLAPQAPTFACFASRSSRSSF